MKKYLLVLVALCGLSFAAAAPKADAFVAVSFGVGGGYPYYGYGPGYYGYGPAYYGGYYPGYVNYGYYGPRYYRHYGGRRVVYRNSHRYYRRGRRVAYYR